ncbi:MAG: C1 family peptidase, partial [Candidatus Thalassarchaeaceae archaeon]
MGKTISKNRVKELRKSFNADPSAKLAQNAVSNNELLEVALDRDLVQEIDFSFSVKLDKWKVTHQKNSGRCWLFATLNLFRPSTMKKMNVKNFEFSQAHI